MKIWRIVTGRVKWRVHIEHMGNTLPVFNGILVQRANIKIMGRERLCVDLRKGHRTDCSIIPISAPSLVEGSQWRLIWTTWCRRWILSRGMAVWILINICAESAWDNASRQQQSSCWCLEGRGIDCRHPDSGFVDFEQICDERVEIDVFVGKIIKGKFFPVPNRF